MSNKHIFQLLYYGLPHIVFFTIASLATYHFKQDFGSSAFAQFAILVISFFTLSSMYLLFIGISSNLIAMRSKKSTHPPVQVEKTKESNLEIFVPNDSYSKAIEQHEQRQHNKQDHALQILIDYTINVMSPHMEKPHLENLCENVRLFLLKEDFNKMQSVETNGKLNNSDFMHFGWNIGKRLGFTNLNTAMFLKRSFPKELQTWETVPLSSNLTLSGPCIIKQDKPTNGSIEFH